MRNKRLIIALLAAIIFGLIAALSVKQYVSNSQEYTRNLNNVVVAKVEIPVGSRLRPEQLEIAQFPANVTPQGAITAIDENLVDRVVLIAMAPKDPITEARLAP